MPSRHASRAASAVAATIALTTSLWLGAPAQATTYGSLFLLQGSPTSSAYGRWTAYGTPTDTVLVGDWDGDGVDTLMMRRGNAYSFTNYWTAGKTHGSFTFGYPTDDVIVGDWDGDGRDTLGVRRSRGVYWYLRAGNGSSSALVRVVTTGSAADRVVVGDWNGDRKDTLAFHRGDGVFRTSNTLGARPSYTWRYGNPGMTPFAGDWDGDGKDTIGLRGGSNVYYLATANRTGSGTRTVTYGYPVDSHIVGRFMPGSRLDMLGVRRTRTVGGTSTSSAPSYITPGLYRSSAPSTGCYWERRTSAGIAANQFAVSHRPVYVQVAMTDKRFVSDGCGTWTQATSLDTPRWLPVTEGTFRLGKDMAWGVYAAPGGPDCHWERLSSFLGTGSAIQQSGTGSVKPRVTISTSTRGFLTSRCGTWTKVAEASPSVPTPTQAPSGGISAADTGVTISPAEAARRLGKSVEELGH